MNQEIKSVLTKIEQNGFEAYVVGGFVRDYLLCKKSNDIDICTNAKPKDIQNIFGSSKANGVYGSYNLKTTQFNYDITTYRMESDFVGRNPSKVEYIDNLLTDLNRRDFTINSICMNKEEKILDFLHGVEDLEKRIIRVIGEPKKRLEEDPLRILRAIRFSCTHEFQIEEQLWKEIVLQKDKIKALSFTRIKKELDAILISPNFKEGLDMLQELGITSWLQIKYQNVTYVNDLCGMWAQMEYSKELPFERNEKRRIEKIQEILNQFILSPKLIFQYGLEPVMIATKIKGIDEKEVIKIQNKMPIESEKDLKVNFQELQEITKTDAKKASEIRNKMITLILEGKLKNKREDVIEYLRQNEVNL